MGEEISPLPKRIRLTGDRFTGGRLPFDALIELERYQEAVRLVARQRWITANPGKDLPVDFDEGTGLVIESLQDGSADLFIGPEQTQIYAEYAQQATDAITAAIDAAYTDSEDSEYDPTGIDYAAREQLAQLGSSLAPGQALELYPHGNDQEPLIINVESRAVGAGNLLIETFFMEPTVNTKPGLETRSDVRLGQIIELNTNKFSFILKLRSGEECRGQFKKSPEMLNDFIDVLDTEEDGPIVRVLGDVQFKGDNPWRITAVRAVERLSFDNHPWERQLTELADLMNQWGEQGDEHAISFTALDAAQSILAGINATDDLSPGVYPLETGGLLIEWSDSESLKSIEISPDASFELFNIKRDQRNGELTETTNLADAQAFATEAAR